jgi:fermentation-respiration switch protein FrsA (DUF1100 family)
MDRRETLSKLDDPRISRFLFYPRRQISDHCPEGAMDRLVASEDGIRLGCRFYLAGKTGPNILFFHGNGEIASDYDDIGPLYTSLGASFLVSDYRGYGRSEGDPKVSAMLKDAHSVFEHVRAWLAEEKRTGGLWIMGRSLGSASALELADCFPDMLDGLIIESGFAAAMPLLRTLGIDPSALGLSDEDDAVGNIAKMARFKKPALVIHAQYDHIIPLPQGEELFYACPSGAKQLYVVPGANHNDILWRDLEGYFRVIFSFIRKNTPAP